MLHSGIGETHVNGVLASLDINPVSHKTLKKVERRIGNVLEAQAKDSCRRRLSEELERTTSATAPPPPESRSGTHQEPRRSFSPSTVTRFKRRLAEGYDLPDPEFALWKEQEQQNEKINPAGEGHSPNNTGRGITISYDMGWAKRGRAMNSLSGVGAAIGAQTGKVVAYGTRNKRCISCDVADREGRKTKPHDCRRNHTGSAKAMEPAVAVQLVQQCEKEGAPVTTIVGDDDSSTMARLSAELSSSITKQSDISHAKRALGSKLYDAKASKKECKQLTATTITYFQKMFSYALRNNGDDADGLRATLLSVVPHAYGDHTSCSETWCGFHKKGEEYKHSSLPYGKDLTCESTRVLLQTIFSSLADQAEKLAPLGSSQVNEALNNTITSKAPKARHYSGSESQDFRTAAAVLQKNHGEQYLAAAIVEAGCSPSSAASKLASAKDKSAAKRRARAGEKSTKVRRRILRETRKSIQTSTELKEGTTYSSGCSFLGAPDTEEIPEPLTAPPAVSVAEDISCSLVFFDLETTSTSTTSEITQLACRDASSQDVFSTYVTPECSISPGATAVTGLSVTSKPDGGRILLKNGTPVPAVTARIGLEQFISWLVKRGKPVILVAHNGKQFDIPVLLNAVHRVGLEEELLQCVLGYSDTLPSLRSALPEESSHSLPNLHQSLFGRPFGAHDALADINALIAVVGKAGVDARSAASTLLSAKQRLIYEAGCQRRKVTLLPLITDKALTKGTARKVAGSGLSFSHLKMAFSRNPERGIATLFKEKVGGRPRITASKKIIEAVNAYFTKCSISAK